MLRESEASMELKDRIISVLKDSNEGLKAKTIAKKLNEEPSKINSILYGYNQEFKVDNDYHWVYIGVGVAT